jgi:hypothetical protein
VIRLLLPLAGHTGYNPGNLTPEDSAGGGGGSGGLGAPWIVAVLVIVLVTVVMLVWLSSPRTRARLRALAPKGVIFVVIAAPLLAWAAASHRGGGREKLVVERWVNPAGGLELIFSLADGGLNTLETTDGRRAVRVACFDRDGRVVLDAVKRWPFLNNESGYDYPHVHQGATREQLQQADRCELRGTRVRLEADVKGVLPS